MGKYLILGGGGFVSHHFIDLLLKEGDEVFATVRWNEDLQRLSKFQGKIKTYYADLSDLSSLIRAIAGCKPDYISLLAAQSWVPYSFEAPITTIETNTIGTVNVLEAVRIIKEFIHKDWNPRIHVCSSSEFYGKVEKDELPITEKNDCRPMNPYACGKVGADYTAQFYHRYFGMDIMITRMFTHSGWGRTMMSAENYYAREIALIEAGQRPVIKTGNMKSIRTFADVRDAVRAYRLMFIHGKSGAIYNIGGDEVRSIQEVLDTLIGLSKLDWSDLTLVDEPRFYRKVDVDAQIVDCSKFKADVSWKPEITFTELMQSLLDYWRERIKTEPFICEI